MLVLAAILTKILFHPLSGVGTSFWGGIGSDVGEVTIIGGIIGMYRHKNCHVDGCWRLGHIDPEHGHPACKLHHSKKDTLGIDPNASR